MAWCWFDCWRDWPRRGLVAVRAIQRSLLTRWSTLTLYSSSLPTRGSNWLELVRHHTHTHVHVCAHTHRHLECTLVIMWFITILISLSLSSFTLSDLSPFLPPLSLTGSHNIYHGNMNLIMGLIWTLIQKYQIRMTSKLVYLTWQLKHLVYISYCK